MVKDSNDSEQKQDTPAQDVAAAETTVEKPVKAGPKARRAVKESIEAGDDQTTTSEKTKPVWVAKARPRAERRGKKYREKHQLIDRTKHYSLEEAVELAQKTSPATFDATVELHLKLDVDPRQADQNIRGTVVLPHGSGKSVRVAVFAPDSEADQAKQAGADLAGEEDILALLKKGQLDFDVLIAHPHVMARLGQFAKLLGPKGLMPNPKSGTVTTNIADAVKQAKSGRVEFRIDKQALLHIPTGKVSFKPAALSSNIHAVYQSVRAARPSSVKGSYIERAYLTTTMGPSIPLDLTSLLN